MGGLTLDTGALIALEDVFRAGASERVRAILSAIDDPDRVVTVPAAVVGEWWRGQRGPAAHVLDAIEVEPMDREIAERAGLVLPAIKKVDRSAGEPAARRRGGRHRRGRAGRHDLHERRR